MSVIINHLKSFCVIFHNSNHCSLSLLIAFSFFFSFFWRVAIKDPLPPSHPIPSILSCHINPLHLLLWYSEEGLGSSSLTLAWQLHLQQQLSLWYSCPSGILSSNPVPPGHFPKKILTSYLCHLQLHLLCFCQCHHFPTQQINVIIKAFLVGKKRERERESIWVVTT